MSSSTQSVVFQCEYWIRVNLALEICVKEALIEVVQNKQNDPAYIGLPEDGTDLYNYMVQIKQNNNHLLQRAQLTNAQWDILCPPTGQTNIKDWDITLLIAVIRSVLNIKPVGGWKITVVNQNDKSVGAFVFLAREIRNALKHGTLKDIVTSAQFNSYWNKIETILKGLNYSRMNVLHQLKTESLDPHVAAIGKILQDLSIEVDVLKDMASDNSKEIAHNLKYIEYLNQYLKHLSNTKADKSELQQKADKSYCDQKADKSELHQKADKSYCDQKADKSYCDQKADKSDLNKKADKSDLDQKADKSDLDQKADKSEMLEHINRRLQNVALQEKQPIKWNIYQTVPNFYGREKLLEGIQCQLQSSAEDDRKPVVLFGLGGIGKTQITAKYIKQYEYLYVNIIWINSSEMKQSLIEILHSHTSFTIPPNASIECLSQMLSKHIKNETTLFVIDDVEDIKNLQKLVRNLKCILKPHILVTTQNGNVDSERYHRKQITCFDQRESILFLQKELYVDETNSGVEDLATALQSFPLAMQQAICYIKKYKMPIVDYIRQFNESNLRLLNVKISFTDYGETLLTVWNLAFEKMKSNLTALKILGMMAYMDHNHINRKTFLYFDEINKDKSKLNEIVELLSEFSLIVVNGNNLQIHPLVQKIIRLSFDKKLMFFEEEPVVLLEKLLFQIMSSFQKDKMHTDEENLWYPHYWWPVEITFDLSIQVAINRNDEMTALNIIQAQYNELKKMYRKTKHLITFLYMVRFHKIWLILKTNLHQVSIEDVMTFEKKNETELKSTHPSIIEWKIQKAGVFYFLKKFKTFENVIMGIYNQIHSEQVEYNTNILLDIAHQLVLIDFERCKEILKKCDDNDKENDNDERIRSFQLRCHIATCEQKFSLAEEILMKWTKMLKDAKVCSNHSYYRNLAYETIRLLLTRGEYDEALKTVDKNIAINHLWWNNLRPSKIKALVKLQRYDEAYELFSELPISNLGVGQSLLLAYLKFLRHDFDGIYELLNSELGLNEDLCYWIQLYVMTLAEFNRKRRSVSTSQESLNKLVQNCIKSKLIIIGFFERACDRFI